MSKTTVVQLALLETKYDTPPSQKAQRSACPSTERAGGPMKGPKVEIGLGYMFDLDKHTH